MGEFLSLLRCGWTSAAGTHWRRLLEEQGSNIEQHLQDYLVDLYREMVPARPSSGDRVLTFKQERLWRS